ncbi:hypothetical protein EW145_g4646 [Phellinidium pouzarii]|uniref:Uncharacterized protein n=1 Tax=Phellinidium pouzarii TaxID=167371 RepID=A0A4S4L2R7_9AGAM|nr:hypothetical protein EW145_g4646 [Phellinidium pouzarii]
MEYPYYPLPVQLQYYTPTYHPQRPQNVYAYSLPPTPLSPYIPPSEPRRLRKRAQRWSFAGDSNADYFHPQYQGGPIPKSAPQPARRVLWMADFMRAPKSTRNPTLHAVLASDTTLVNFDVRVPPKSMIDPKAYTRFSGEWATIRPTKHMRLISHDFPWIFELDFRDIPSTKYITCGDVWTALQTGLSEALTDAEWSLLATNKSTEESERKRVIERITSMRRSYARRVDWLGRNVVFRGLAKDDKYAQKMLLPGREPTTFINGQWKGHTQCISEAEKYQKGLYKGKKTNGSSGSQGEKPAKSQTAFEKVPESEQGKARPISENKVESRADKMAIDESGIAEEKQTELSVKDRKTDAKNKKRKRKTEALDKASESIAPLASETDAEESTEKKRQKKRDVDEGGAKIGKAISERAATLDKTLKASPNVLVSQVVDEKSERKERKEKKRRGKSAERVAVDESAVVGVTEGSPLPIEQDGSLPSDKKKRREGKDRDSKGAAGTEAKAGELVDTIIVGESAESKKKRKDGSKKKIKRKGEVLIEDDADESRKTSATADEENKALMKKPGMEKLSFHEVSVKEGKTEKRKKREKRTAETLDRPSVFSRHVSYAEPVLAPTYDADSWPPATLPGLPLEKMRRAQWFGRQLKSHHPWSSIPEPGSLSPRSTTATASDSQDMSTVTDEFSSGSSSHYSGFNSAVYSRHSYDSLPSQVHALLDASTASLIWDVRHEPKTLNTSPSTSRFFGPNALSFPLTSTGAGHIRIYSPDFPWTIEIGPKPRAITASDALHALHELLNRNFDDTVWALADENMKASIERTRKKRTDSKDRLKNVDWLGNRYMFKGFYRDDAFVQHRLQPSTKPVSETWLVTFSKP